MKNYLSFLLPASLVLLFLSLTPRVLAADCAFWKCGVPVNQCIGGLDNVHSCNPNLPASCRGGDCAEICGLPEYSESGSSCSYGCPPGNCVRPGSTSCNCGGGGGCNPIECESQTCDCVTGHCCWDGCRPIDESCSYCGDGSCHGSETCSSCPGDCGSCGPR